MHLPPQIGAAEFQKVSSLDEEQIRRNFSRFAPQLHRFLNSVPCLSDLHNVRRKMWKRGAPASDGPFGTFAPDTNHWYSYNHGGRNEAQLNVGMFPEYFRVGIGFEMTGKKGGDPAHVHMLYSVFVDMLKRQQADAEAMSKRLHLEVEWERSTGGDLEHVGPEEAVAFLANPTREFRWMFWGRRLHRGRDDGILGDSEAFGTILEEVLCSLVPYWIETNHRGHLMLHG
jgi:hypothetical protein